MLIQGPERSIEAFSVNVEQQLLMVSSGFFEDFIGRDIIWVTLVESDAFGFAASHDAATFELAKLRRNHGPVSRTLGSIEVDDHPVVSHPFLMSVCCVGECCRVVPLVSSSVENRQPFLACRIELSGSNSDELVLGSLLSVFRVDAE